MSITESNAVEPIPVEPVTNPPGNPVEQLLGEIVESVHPLLAEAFFCAALPHWYDLELFTAIRAIGDERNEGLIPRLEKYSFILRLPDTTEPTFRTRDTARRILNERWIDKDIAAYLAAHQRAHDYWQTYQSDDSRLHSSRLHSGRLHSSREHSSSSSGSTPPDNDSSTHKLDIDEITREQNQLYHHYFVDLADATSELSKLFRSYYGDRLLAAVERLLHMADEARDYLRLLHNSGSSNPESGTPNSDNPNSGNITPETPNAGTTNVAKHSPEDLAHFEHLIDHLYARQAQLQGRWLESIAMFEALRDKPGLTPELVPFVARGYASSLKEAGLYVESISEYKRALALFKKQAQVRERQSAAQQDVYLSSHRGLKIEQGLTMVNLGEAYVDFALSANVDPTKAMQPKDGWWERVQQVYEFFTALPLVVYLSIYIGRRVWHPSFWRVLENLDWIIGRLFAKGADQYLRADKILDAYGNDSQSVLANEKLAFLYLKMGDFAQARTLFVHLLERTPSPLSEYHRALVRRGLAEAELALGEPEVARLNLNKSLPILRAYEDVPQVAEAQTLQAEVALAMDEPALALDQFEQVLTHYVQTDNHEKATTLHERLKEIVRLQRLPADYDGNAQLLADRVTKRRYPVRFRSLATIFTQRALLALLALVLILIPSQTIFLESRTAIAPEINFNVPPLLLENEATFKPTLSIDVKGSNALSFNHTDVLRAEAALLIVLWLVLAYLLFVTLMGLLAIFSTPLHRVQRTMQSRTVDVHAGGIRFGSEQVRQFVPWESVRQVVRSDMSLWSGRLRLDDSAMMIAIATGSDDEKDGERDRDRADAHRSKIFTIRGSTAWYTPLLDWIVTRLPETTQKYNLSFSWLRNWAGLLYGFGLLAFAALTLYIRFFEQTVGGLTADLPLLGYSLFDLYPYLYIPIFIPPMLWFVVRPLRIRSYLSPRSLVPWLTGGIGLMLLALRILTGFRPWITVPDIYPAGMILVLIVTSTAVIWQVRDPSRGGSIFPFWSRVSAVIIALLVTVVAGTYVSREIVAYHYLVQGHYFRDQEQRFMQQQEPPVLSETRTESARLLNLALDKYDRAHTVAKYPLPWLRRTNTSGVNQLGLPSYDQITWYASGKNLADIASKLRNQNEPIKIAPDQYYQKLLINAPDDSKASIQIARALALTEDINKQMGEAKNLEIDALRYRNAIEQFTMVIDNAESKGEADAALYRLLRGMAYHALYSPDNVLTRGFQDNTIADYEQALKDADLGLLDDEWAASALVGLGWIAYQTELEKRPAEQNFGLALERFQRASIQDSRSVEALLGMGYVHYRTAELALTQFRRLPSNEQDLPSGKRLLQRAQRELDNAERRWLHARNLNPFEPSIPISLATLYWKSSNEIFGQELTDRCDGYERSVDLLVKTLERDTMRIQQDKDVAFTYRTAAQITWLRQEIGCPETDPIAFHKHVIEDYRQAILLDPENANFLHMRARLNNSLARLYLKGSAEAQPSQGDVQKEIFPLLMSALTEMDKALTIAPENDRAINYYPNDYLGSIVKRGLDNGFALFKQGEQSNAVEIYNKAIMVAAQHNGNRESLEKAATDLADYLQESPSTSGEALQVALNRAIAILTLTDPTAAFDEGLDQLSQGNDIMALDNYRRGLQMAVAQRDIRSTAIALANLYEAEHASASEVIAIFSQFFPQLTQVQETVSNTDALNLSFIAAAIGKISTSTYWYAQGVHRSTATGPNVLMNANAQAIRLTYAWQNNGSQIEAMLANVPGVISDQLFLEPDLEENGAYWRTWAWSLYHLGREAFLQGDEAAAKAALVVGQPYADRAAELGQAGVDVVNTYYSEGAWTWYHFVRAKQKQAEADYDGALADYHLAARASRPETNRVAFAERAQTAFRVGLMALHTDNKPLALIWYQQGINYVENDADKGNMSAQLTNAIEELEQALAAKPRLRSNGESILQLLAQASDNQSN